MKIVIIGAGPGGYETAVLAAKRGADVTLVESCAVGGTCLNEGCIPTKAFCRSAAMLEELGSASTLGITGLAYGFDFNAASARKDAIVAQLRDGVMALLSHPRIRLVHGRASFADSTTVRVSSDSGSQSGNGEELISADCIIIATGSRPVFPDIPGKNLPGVVTSRELLGSESVPRRLCIIGAGVIGLEFASIFRSFGSEVTVIEYCREVLPRFDADIAKRLRQSLSKRGINFLTGTKVTAIVPSSMSGQTSDDTGGGLSVRFEKKGSGGTVGADKVLMAVGRRPALDTLNLDDAGIEYTPRGITVDAFMRTNVPGIYAVGDITGGVMLAHAAVMQGVRALDHAMGIEDNVNLAVMPAAVFTMPEVAAVGKTEEECREAGIEYICRKSFFRANGKALCLGETEGLCKLIADRNGKLLGCHICGPHASDLIHEAAALVASGAGLDDLRSLVHVHPSLSEVLRAAASE